MPADGTANNLMNTIVYCPAVRETINAVLSGSYIQQSSSVSPATTA